MANVDRRHHESYKMDIRAVMFGRLERHAELTSDINMLKRVCVDIESANFDHGINLWQIHEAIKSLEKALDNSVKATLDLASGVPDFRML